MFLSVSVTGSRASLLAAYTGMYDSVNGACGRRPLGSQCLWDYVQPLAFLPLCVRPVRPYEGL